MTATGGAEASRTLIVRVGAMGDILHALPAVAALRQARPEAYLGWIVEPRWLPLLCSENGSEQDLATDGSSRMPLVNECFSANTSLWKKHGVSAATVGDLRRLRGMLHGKRFDTCVDMQGSLRSACLGKLSGAGHLVGRSNPRERPARWLYTERVETPARHVVVQGCELLGAALGVQLSPVTVELPSHPESQQWADALLAGHNRPVLLAPTAGWGAKEWPAERFGAVARVLADRGYRVLVNAVSSRDETAHRVVSASAGTAEMIVCTLTQLIELIRRSALVLAGDTGPLHLAAAMAVPVVGLYGPTDPARTGPWSPHARVLRDPASVTDHKRHRATEAGLLNIEVEQVTEALWEYLPREQ